MEKVNESTNKYNDQLQDVINIAKESALVALIGAAISTSGLVSIVDTYNMLKNNLDYRYCVGIICYDGDIEIEDYGYTEDLKETSYELITSGNNESAIVYVYGKDFADAYETAESIAANITFTEDNKVYILQEEYNNAVSYIEEHDPVRTRK